MQGLRAVDQCLFGVRMEIRQDHVGTCDDALGSGMHHVENISRIPAASADGMRGVDAHGQMGQPPNHRNMGEINEIAVRITQVSFHAAKAKDDVVIAFAGQIFCRVQ